MPGQSVAARSLTLRAHFGADRHSTLSLPTLYFCLYQGDPSGAGIEPTSVGGYARPAKANDLTLWGAIAAGDTLAQNKGTAGEIAWPVATGVYSILTALDYWAIRDNSAGGALWYWGPLGTPILVTGAGDQPRLPANTLIVNQPT